MKAAVVRSFDRPLEIEELPIPVPGPDQVLVRIETSGLCHTDIHAGRHSKHAQKKRIQDTGEPDEAKVSRPVRRGAVGKVPENG